MLQTWPPRATLSQTDFGDTFPQKMNNPFDYQAGVKSTGESNKISLNSTAALLKKNLTMAFHPFHQNKGTDTESFFVTIICRVTDAVLLPRNNANNLQV